MTFDDWQREIIASSASYGSAAGLKVRTRPAETQKFLAAAAMVIEARGPAWCQSNPAEFRSEILKKIDLRLVVRIGLAIVSLLIPGGSVWLTLADLLVPVLVGWIGDYFSVSPAGAPQAISDWSSVVAGAKDAFKGRGRK